MRFWIVKRLTRMIARLISPAVTVIMIDDETRQVRMAMVGDHRVVAHFMAAAETMKAFVTSEGAGNTGKVH